MGGEPGIHVDVISPIKPTHKPHQQGNATTKLPKNGDMNNDIEVKGVGQAFKFNMCRPRRPPLETRGHVSQQVKWGIHELEFSAASVNAQLDLGNFENRLTLEGICPVPQAVPSAKWSMLNTTPVRGFNVVAEWPRRSHTDHLR